MIFDIKDTIDQRYEIESICGSKGGMGELYFVKDLKNELVGKLLLKICVREDEEYIRRFRREIRLLKEFQGNSKVVQILDSNPDYDQPYFVMRYYKDGDLTNWAFKVRLDSELQEKVFNQMIACIGELHAKEQYHRDIKPQNFLIDGESIVVSDFGLSMELDSSTKFTNTSDGWGSSGYIPPEYKNGGFKKADATGDIFMLGKSFYNLLTNRDPAYLSKDDIDAPLYYVIERCCDLDKRKRYQTLAALQQELQLVFDVILNRGGVVGKTNQLLLSINNGLANGKYEADVIVEFIEKLSMLDEERKSRVIQDLHRQFFAVLTANNKVILDVLPRFMESYAIMVEKGDYSWGYAETIANNMKVIFDDSKLLLEIRAKALDLAIKSAHLMNRFAAMDTCNAMIRGVNDEKLGQLIYPIIENNANSFISSIEPSMCHSDAVIKALTSIKTNSLN